MHLNVGTPVHIFPQIKDGVEVVPEFEGRVGRVTFQPELHIISVDIYDKKIINFAMKHRLAYDKAFNEFVVCEIGKRFRKHYCTALALGCLLGAIITGVLMRA